MIALRVWLCARMALLSRLLRASEASERWWGRALALAPSHPRALASIGFLKAAAGDYAAALPWLERSAALSDAPPSAWFNLGFARQQLGDHDGANQAFDRAIALDERFDRAWYGKAISMLAMARPADAIPLLERNTALQPMSPYGWYQLAHAYHRLGRADRVAATIRHLAGFEPAVARRLERETGVCAAAGEGGCG